MTTINSILSVMLLGGSALSAQAEVLSVEKLTQLNKVHSVAVSSDGRQLVYGVKTPEGSDLYLQPLSAMSSSYTGSANLAKATRLTYDSSSETAVRFSSDGQAIYFLSARSGSNQLWRLPLSGGEARPVTDLPMDIEGYTLSSDNQSVVLSLDVYPECDTLACTIERDANPPAHNGQVYDSLMVRHWDHWNDNKVRHLFSAKLTDKVITDAKDITPQWQTDVPAKPFSGMEEVAISPDGTKVVFSAKVKAPDNAWSTNFDLFEVAIEGGSIRNLTEANKAWDAAPQFSADGRYLAYKATTKPGFESDKFTLQLLDLRTGENKALAPQWDRSVSSFQFGANGRAIYATAKDLGQTSLFEISTGFGDIRSVFSDGYVGDVQVVGEQIVFSRHALNSPKELYRINRDGSGLMQLSDVNKEKMADVTLGDVEQFSFSGANDEQVYGYLVKPALFDANKRYPLAFLVHGGPQGSFGNMFHSRWNAQLWAAQGYGVVMIDFHGSVGYGQAFTNSISRDWGGKPLLDLQKGLDYVGDNYAWLDINNGCALGASYGGYMMNWIAGNWPKGFNCLVNHAGLFDMPSFHQSTEELWFAEHEMGGPFWAKDGDYSKYNPANFVANWQTPMLVTQGLKDYRVPYAQSLGAFTTLQRKGIDSRLVVYPEENHWIHNPDNLIHWYQQVFAWMAKYTQPQSEQ
ncbi:alpha/beta hydrolase family protein [Pseudoalteromonas ruthenica]|uniref:alpha/beta hydrolase family protein n=1 Tax=Pseudoalteromonas ruthenica TaxID=151081 RepID=UPI001486CBE4|nr:S9 family peptidase [Pseudoalteromonas ruthenica]